MSDDSLSAVMAATGALIKAEKSEHYLNFYEELFGAQRHDPLKILELGVLEGGSALMFSRYFDNSLLLFVDIKRPPDRFYRALDELGIPPRGKVVIGSQDDHTFLERECKAHFDEQLLDLIIDDASHMYKYTKSSFEYLFYKRLKPGAWYIIEDWGCGYWPKWADGNPDCQHGLPLLVKEMVDLLAMYDRTKDFKGATSIPAKAPVHGPFDRMLLVPGICALRKAI